MLHYKDEFFIKVVSIACYLKQKKSIVSLYETQSISLVKLYKAICGQWLGIPGIFDRILK